MYLRRRLSTLVILLSSLSQAMISLLQSASFYLVRFIEHFKLISSDVSSLFILVECLWSRLTSGSSLSHSIELVSFKLFKQIHYQVTSSVMRSILNASLKQTHCSDFCLLHVCSKTCSIRWLTQSRDQLVSFDLHLLHACSKVVSFVFITFNRACFIHVYYTHVVKLVSFVDRLNQVINYWLVIVADLSFLSFKQSSFYSASNIQQSMSFSSYLCDFRHIIYVSFSVLRHIVYVSFCSQYISSCCCYQCRE